MSDKSLRDLRLETPQAVTKGAKLEFPCDYPLKIVGDAADDFHLVVADVVESHAPGFDRTTLSVVDSRNGKFQSVRVTIVATGQPQLEALFAELKSTGRVHMVL
ncbi:MULTISPECIES: YbeD family protein [Halomonadaceae]|uniref:HP0495 family protein n=1 Tax=Halomonadaceae TaxID=28256 RepID=UPI00159B8065|nr:MULTISPECIES: DUF493 domain-containing protein [Halomonas]QJQ94103.1 DUF493 domain-containing protein [Halomonas sp. PA5]